MGLKPWQGFYSALSPAHVTRGRPGHRHRTQQFCARGTTALFFPFHFLQQIREIPTLIGSTEEIYWTLAAGPPDSCHVRPAFLDTFCPGGMAVPFPETDIQSKFGQAAQTQQEPFKSGKQKGIDGEIKEGDASEGTQRGGLLQSFTFNYTSSFVLFPLALQRKNEIWFS